MECLWGEAQRSMCDTANGLELALNRAEVSGDSLQTDPGGGKWGKLMDFNQLTTLANTRGG